ncbi:biopolymer transporter ExbB [Defluviimonas sp. D31]|uniref:biopolymer transporter ExbB n=1 Tax=Defluviimonas sp. D31 TaxID=3083253 RepID=UPI00296F858B|nr:biopolymer transporter ExbB [Defluviimonas sp. D31]MDW4549431.1 biopolymer transporter ExbB [Defluviimonas sp. D31]
MAKSMRSAEPFFSQPVRQIAMMLLVSVLVGAGAYVAYGPIISIFSANLWLNGLILGVFVFGVLTCFWQVAQLVRSVSWIEGFAAQQPGHEMTIAPSMLAPLAALLRSRGRRGGQISSTSAGSILESVSTRIEEARDITRYLTSLLIFLGLLGTFYGLAITVPAVVDTIRALAPQEGETGMQVFDKLMGGLEKQLGGMGTAFSSSLLGLAGSLVVGLLELFAGHGQNRFYRELEEWLTSFTRLSFAGGDGDAAPDGDAVAGVLDHMAGQVETLQAILQQSDAGRAAVNERLESLIAAVGNLTHRLEAEAGASAVLARIADGQDRVASLIERNGPVAAGNDGGDDAESRMRLRSIDVQLLRLLEEVAAGRQESMADLRGDIAQLTRAVRALGRPDPVRKG